MISRIALSGLNAAYSRLRTTANNLANTQTTGFKQSRTELVANPGSNGVRVSNIRSSEQSGVLHHTQQATDLGITGEGYFQVSDGGKQSFTRAGAFQIDRDGYVVNSQNQRLMGFTPQSGGTPVELKLDDGARQAKATTNIDINANLDASATPPAAAFDPADPASFNSQTSTTAYDSLGSQHQVDFYYSKTATPNQYEMRTYIDGNAVGGAQTLDFDSAGNLTSPAGGVTLPAYNPGNGASNLNITVDTKDLTHYGADFGVNSINQDGSSTASVTSIEFDKQGNVNARLSNGESQHLGRVAVAQFNNPQGLQPEGNGTLSATHDAGDPVYQTNLDSIQSGALESSNVNLEEQLVNLKSAEHHAAAAAKMIKVEDELLGTLFNSKA